MQARVFRACYRYYRHSASGVADNKRIFNFTDLSTGIRSIYTYVCSIAVVCWTLILKYMGGRSAPNGSFRKSELCMLFVSYYMAIGGGGVSEILWNIQRSRGIKADKRTSFQ